MTELKEVEVPYTREGISKMLQEKAHIVSFYKTDGTIRDMTCTLVGTELPKREEKPFDKNNMEVDAKKEPRKQNLAVLAVYDLEAKGWRSFRIENVFDVVPV